LFEAARWSPSSYNEQPWRFIVASKSEDHAEFDKLCNTLNDSNKAWAHQAAALIAVAAKLTLTKNGKPNRHASYDAGGAVANLTMQAVSLGLQAHQMAGFNSQILSEVYNVPADFELMAVLAVGYPDDRLLGQRLRERKELNEFVFQNVWETPFTITNQ
jgi:nitroreductase